MAVGQWKLQRSLSATNHCSDADAHEAVADVVIKIYDARQTFFNCLTVACLFFQKKRVKKKSALPVGSLLTK